ncbi:serine/threonine protein kinase (plasmid) [Bacillus sp. JAS24-2]|uniref:serine/threonine-protein kinase n=1 Tax=Bacillus sp. JAS24-2 TaxID=2217832 RepID=UPI0011EE4A50|nr:serine/threonine-protein kinase [Bacillus sp. JAS24-2]QEL82641.1 serine/threonine protein kinase [Bacillus sp. JAS24-2]
MSLLVTTELKFKPIKEIGQEGKNSDVHLVHDPQLNAELVVKRIKKDSMKVEEYFKEAHILYNYPHPNIVEINYASSEEDYVYIAMPHYKNGSINALMKQKSLTVREIIQYSLDFLLGLHFIHTQGLIHFDVKPTNILINHSNRALITDFGLAKYIDIDATASPEMTYMPQQTPESITQQDLTLHADIYQSGITLYRMCNGNDVFRQQLTQYHSMDAFDDAVKKGTFPNRKFYLPHIPKSLIKVINDMMKPDPDKRPQNLLITINALSKIDKNLDWEYTIDNESRTEVWSLEKEKTKDSIILSFNGQEWSTKGEKLLKTSGNTQQIHAFKHTSITSQADAYNIIAKMISNHT